MSVAGKTIVITGATSGMGEAAALELARQGARMVLIARDKARGDVTMAKLKAANPNANHTIHYGDLSRIAEMKRVASEVAAAEPKIDVLINNAGAVFLSRKVSADGLEMTFATNHMAYFVVTNLLLDRLKATPGARIVSTSSDAHKAGKVDFNDLQFEKSYASFRAYGTSKLENILFTRELAKRLAGTGVTANCLHPGFVGTRFGMNNASNIFLKGLARLILAFGLKPEEGAKTIVYLAASDDVAKTTGEYFYKCKIEKTTDAAKSDADAKRLWDVSAKLAGL
jgi:NAD(P)-dependent dehydrogenase (short-subunit alcohol dehydrogenase family)